MFKSIRNVSNMNRCAPGATRFESDCSRHAINPIRISSSASDMDRYESACDVVDVNRCATDATRFESDCDAYEMNPIQIC